MAWLARSWSSTPETARSALLVIAAIAIGLIAWSGEPRLLPAAMLFPALWALAPTRLSAALVAGGYFLSASRGLPQGVSNFYGAGFAAGIALWIAASFLFVATNGLLWTKRPGRARVIRYAIIAVLLSIPPVDIVGWAHPITAAGILFAGWSWFGLGAAAIGLLVMTTRFRPIAILTLGGLWIWSAANWTDPSLPEGWISVDTEFGGSNGQYADYEQHLETINRVREAAEAGASVIVLPESALGVWTPTIERLWTRALGDLDATVYGGAAIVDETGYDNVMLELSGQSAVARYLERMPVPVSMWQPWLGLIGVPASARAYFFANPVVAVRDARVATLTCYEQLLVWPILQSALHTPDVLVAPANGWWTGDTDIVAVQIAATKAWSRLFTLPLIIAINT
ncbi:conjugal transfer protein TraB [Aquibium sp. ELW1220]|uniref:conjugal transfer protein TraB n=1 Tax=Aquibium sp. ELW1220 TaxID=2976766 RepID=UPI0025AF02B7|nr:conjugal transfer protein TraB [Aquibium sp. ELW1220]MDN2583765.1 conjugal transfer protein TraB [Aquibium sp. ELW1220]